MKAISPLKREQAISLLQNGLSNRNVASITGVSKSTISRIAQEMDIDKENLKGGCPSKLSPTDQRRIIHSITSGKLDNAVQATHFINSINESHVSSKTVRRTLKQHGLKAVVKAKRPLLKAQHRKARLSFALKYQNWTVDDWKRVLWSDETKINKIGSDGHQYVWKKAGEPLSDRTTQPTVKFGGGNIMVWGCMGWNGVGMLAEIEGRMDSAQYVEILAQHLSQSIEYLEIPAGEAIFQQDNDPKHTSKMAQKWFSENHIQVLDWPAQSPDLNPIEHLWFHLKKQLQKYPSPPKGVWELWERVEVEWPKIEPQECQKLIESIPRRLAAVIKAKGGHTKY
jgi:transposase